MRKGNLLVISGPSGAGKGTLVARLLKAVPDTWVSVSATTRDPRAGEVEGINYFFMKKEEFETLVENNGLLEWARVHDNYYGTPRKPIEEHIALGLQVVLEIDVQGAMQVREAMPEAKLIFIEPPSLEILEERLRGRGTETEEEILTRLSNARVELSMKKEYDIQLVNDDIARSTKELVDIVNAYAEENEGSL